MEALVRYTPSMLKNCLDDLHVAVSGERIGFVGVVGLQDQLYQELAEFDRRVYRQVGDLLGSSNAHWFQPHPLLS
jgi:hypothetical protein